MWWFAPGTVCLIAWGVLAFGGEYPWAYAPLLVFASTVGVLGLVAPVSGKGVSRSVVLALALIAAAIGLQLVPLGESVLAVVSPARVEQDYRALLAAAVPVLPGPEEAASGGPRPISVRPARTLLGLSFFLALSLFFLGCFRALSAVRASGAVRGLMALGVVVALVAIVQETSRSPLVYGVWWPRKVESLPAAPFINENHLAGWLVMAYSMALGYFCGGLALGRVDASVGWRRRVIWLGSRDGSEVLLAGLAVLVMALAVVVTLSVSGLACLLLVCLVFGWWTTRGTGRTGWRVLCLAGLVSVPLAAIGWLGIDVVGGELAMASWSDVGGRVGIWRDTLRMIGDFPISGTGFNTFGVAMLAYQTYRTDVHVVEAHNDYLQLTAEGGALVGLPILFGIVVFARQVRRRFREANDDMRIYWLRIGAVTGLAALAFQSVVDFSLQMPGNAVTFALLMAVAAHRPPPPSTRLRPVGG